MTAYFDPVKNKWFDSKTGKETTNPNAQKDISYYENLAHIDSIFESDPELKQLLSDAVKNEYTDQMFQQMLEGTNWAKQHSTDMRSRGFEQRQYQDLISAGKDTSQTTWARGIDGAKATLRRLLTVKGITFTDADLSKYAQDVYSVGRETDSDYINSYLNKLVGFAGKDKQKGKGADFLAQLQDYGSDFGIDVQKDISSSTLSSWLQALDMGESLQTYKNQIKNFALVGQSDYVKKLVDSGLTLKDVYSPAIEQISSTLGKRVTIRQAMTDFNSYIFNDKGEMNNTFVIKSNLKKHPDWPTTPEAIGDVNVKLLKIFQDFGIEG